MNQNRTKLKKSSKGLRPGFQIIIIGIVWLMIAAIFPVAQAGAETASSRVSSSDDETAFQASLSHLQTQAAEWGIKDAKEEFRLRRVARDDLGIIHVRLDQMYNGIPVFGQQMIVHINSNGSLQSVTGSYKAGITVQTQPKISGQIAREKALQFFNGPVTNNPETELLVYPMDGITTLVYRVVMEDESAPKRIVAFVDAMTGKIIDSYDDLQTFLPSTEVQTQLVKEQDSSDKKTLSVTTVAPAKGIGRSLYSGTINIITLNQSKKYYTLDPLKGSGSQVSGYMRTSDLNNGYSGDGIIFSDLDNVWGNGQNTDRATAGVDAHYGAEMTWDYYLQSFNRKGIYNDNKGTLSRVHYGVKYNNAFWDSSCRCMTYGDGDGITFSPLVSLDIAGHEMTHGVTESVAGLIYTRQSGGLNEAMSDIFGTIVEFYAASRGANKTPNYLIGEDAYTPAIPGDALRYMNNPTKDGHSIDNFLDYRDGIDVHYSSGIANNAFYLLAEGGTHRLGGKVTGIGKAKAMRIFFRALDVYMIPTETFSQARAHTIQAATDLYGASSQEVTSVKQTWDAVKVV
ncbi:MAG: M4 family metallopeptidase [Candidatus Methanoperedens sp.]|nr:M4 family metallopeptidase [Candidatus Methanoperedens sp.]MCZ7371816.1 M4 family metallopeptidase [Candidatus Methanoperedens sp.]